VASYPSISCYLTTLVKLFHHSMQWTGKHRCWVWIVETAEYDVVRLLLLMMVSRLLATCPGNINTRGLHRPSSNLLLSQNSWCANLHNFCNDFNPDFNERPWYLIDFTKNCVQQSVQHNLTIKMKTQIHNNMYNFINTLCYILTFTFLVPAHPGSPGQIPAEQ